MDEHPDVVAAALLLLDAIWLEDAAEAGDEIVLTPDEADRMAQRIRSVLD